MNYMGMPWGVWTLFSGSFQAQLTDVLGYNEQTARKSSPPKALPDCRRRHR